VGNISGGESTPDMTSGTSRILAKYETKRCSRNLEESEPDKDDSPHSKDEKIPEKNSGTVPQRDCVRCYGILRNGQGGGKKL